MVVFPDAVYISVNSEWLTIYL